MGTVGSHSRPGSDLEPWWRDSVTIRRILLAAVVISALVAALLWGKNGDRLAAEVCRARYAAAKNTADSFSVDNTPSGIEHRGYVAASCGLLRKTGSH